MELAAGVLLIILAAVHTIFGEKEFSVKLREMGDDGLLTGSVRVMSMQGGVLLLLTGLIQIGSYFKVIVLDGIGSFIPLALLSVNFLVFLLVSAISHRELLRVSPFQLVIFPALIVLEAIILF